MRASGLLPMVLAATIAAAPLAAPTPTPVPRPTPPMEKVVVRLVQLDVVVRDKQGRLVRGLGAADFRVLEDGLPLEVAGVDSWESIASAPAPEPAPAPAEVPEAASPGSAAPAPAPAPPAERERRSIVVLFDNLNGTTAMKLAQAKKAAADFVRKNLGPRDLASIYALDLTLRPMCGFSSNTDELARAIQRVTWFPSTNLSEQISESILAYQSKSTARYMQERLQQSANLEGERLDWSRQHVYRSLNDLASIFEAVPGRRMLVLVSSGFPMTAAGDLERMRGGFTPEFRDLIKTLGRNGVAVYSIDVGDDLAMGDVSKMIDWRVAVGTLGMDETFLNDVGLDTSFGAGSASSRREFLGVIANETGGRLLTPSDLSKAFDTIQEDSANFYRVSCRVPERGDDGRYRRIVVKVNRPGAVVTARRGRYSDVYPGASAPPSERAADSLDRYAPLLLRTSATVLPADSDKKIPVAIVAEAAGPVALAPDPEGGGGRIDLDFLAVARVDGEIVGRYAKTVTARIRPEGIEAVKNGFRVEGRFDLPAGLYDLQATVRLKEPAQLGTWRGPIAVPPPSRREGLRFAGALLSKENTESPLLMRADLPAGQSDVLAVDPGTRLLPPVEATFRKGDALLAMFWLAGLPPSAEPPKLEFNVTAVDASGSAATPAGRLVLFRPEGPLYRLILRVESGALAPGAWQLRVTAKPKDPAEPAAVEARLPFVVEAPATSPPSP